MNRTLAILALALALTGCASPRPEKTRVVYTGPYARRLLDGYSRSEGTPKDWPLTKDNSDWSREKQYLDNTAYTRETGRESLDHYLNRTPVEP